MCLSRLDNKLFLTQRLLTIIIKDSYVKKFIKDEKITRISFLANAGGLLGLCMGFSVISVAEIVYHIAFSIFTSLKSHQKCASEDIGNDELPSAPPPPPRFPQPIKCYSRRCNRCPIHNIITETQKYGPYFHNKFQTSRGHFTSPNYIYTAP